MTHVGYTGMLDFSRSRSVIYLQTIEIGGYRAQRIWECLCKIEAQLLMQLTRTSDHRHTGESLLACIRCSVESAWVASLWSDIAAHTSTPQTVKMTPPTCVTCRRSACTA